MFVHRRIGMFVFRDPRIITDVCFVTPSIMSNHI